MREQMVIEQYSNGLFASVFEIHLKKTLLYLVYLSNQLLVTS